MMTHAGVKGRLRRWLRSGRRHTDVEHFAGLVFTAGLAGGMAVGLVLVAMLEAEAVLMPDGAAPSWGMVGFFGFFAVVAVAFSLYINRQAVKERRRWAWVVERLERARGEGE